MSWVSNAFGGIKHAVQGAAHPLGHYLSESGKLASLVPGVGPAIGGAMTAAGGLIEGDGVHDSLINGVKSGIQNYGIGKLTGGHGLPGLMSAGSSLLHGQTGAPAASSDPNDASYMDPADPNNANYGQSGGIGGAIGKIGSALGAGKVPGLQGVTDFLGGNGGTNALVAAQGANAAMLGKKSSDYADNAMGSAQSNWDSRQGLRDAGNAGMLNPGQGIAAKVAAIPQHNMFAKPQIAPQTPQIAPVAS